MRDESSTPAIAPNQGDFDGAGKVAEAGGTCASDRSGATPAEVRTKRRVRGGGSREASGHSGRHELRGAHYARRADGQADGVVQEPAISAWAALDSVADYGVV